MHKILIAEDDRELRQLFSHVLTKHGYTVKGVSDGQEALDAMIEIPYSQGYCYTQLTDVMQEINGLLTPDRKPKMDVERVRALNRNPDWNGDRDMKDAVASSW